MEHIKNVLSDVISDLEKRKETLQERIFALWCTTVEENIKKHTKPIRFKKNVLYLIVDESTWAYEISQKHKSRLINQMNEELGEKKIYEIRIRVGDIS
ncbi:MAG: DUF721 domain-containing protein [Candidatus Omnitrophica bacterium]|nr:DUF721 domain-containing protein [Candidatus Omnitrophota bacterium]